MRRLAWWSVIPLSIAAGIYGAMLWVRKSRTQTDFQDQAASCPCPFREKFLKMSGGLPHPKEFPLIAILDSGLDQVLAEKEGVSVPWEIAQQASFAADAATSGLWDDLYHGTGITLELSAKANGFGIVGLLPEAPVLPIRLGSRDEFIKRQIPFSRLEDAFYFAAKRQARIIVMSVSDIESRWPKKRMQALLKKYQDKLLVINAAGNDKRTLELGKECPYTPSCLTAPNLIKVGASDYERSNSGPLVDVSVVSECRQWRLSQGGEPVVVTLKSTSVAAPKVAAVAALMLALRPLGLAEAALHIKASTTQTGELDLETLFQSWMRAQPNP